MANPNIVNVSSIYGGILTHTASTQQSVVISNGANSGVITKINTVMAANVGTSAVALTVRVGMPTGSYIPLMKDVSVPVGSTLVVVDKSTSLYLIENWAMTVECSSDNDIQLIVSYEEIS